NVYQWTETINPAGTKRSYHGGSMFSGAGELPSTLNLGSPITGGPPGGWWDDPSVQAPSLGFRVATAVLPDPGIVQEPANTTVGLGGTATLTVVPTGTSPFTYQWQFYGTNLTSVVAT